VRCCTATLGRRSIEHNDLIGLLEGTARRSNNSVRTYETAAHDPSRHSDREQFECTRLGAHVWRELHEVLPAAIVSRPVLPR